MKTKRRRPIITDFTSPRATMRFTVRSESEVISLACRTDNVTRSIFISVGLPIQAMCGLYRVIYNAQKPTDLKISLFYCLFSKRYAKRKMAAGCARRQIFRSPMFS